MRKDAENKGSKVSFYSREGGGSELGPRLILEYGGQSANRSSGASQLASFLGFGKRQVALTAVGGNSEGSGVREFMRRSPKSAFVVEQIVLGLAGGHPLTQLGARAAYRSWLRGEPSLV